MENTPILDDHRWGKNTNDHLRLNFIPNSYFRAFPVCFHELIYESEYLLLLLVSGNNEISQYMLGASSPDHVLVIQYTHFSTLWVGLISSMKLKQDDS